MLKFAIFPSNLLSAVKFLEPLASRTREEDIVQNIRLCTTAGDYLAHLMATDYSTQLEFQVRNLKAEVSTEILLDAGMLKKVLSAMGADIATCEYNEKTRELSIDDQHLHYSLRTAENKGFPEIETDKVTTKKVFTIPATDLSVWLDQTAFCICSDEYRQYLRGLRIEIFEDGALHLFSSNSVMLAHLTAKVKNPGHEKVKTIIQQGTINLLRKLITGCNGEVEIIFGDAAWVQFRLLSKEEDQKYATWVLTSKLLNCEYPNAYAILLTPERTLAIATPDREELIQRLQGLNAINFQGTPSVTFEFKDNQLNLSCLNSRKENASTHLPCTWAGDPFSITYNSEFVLQILNHVHYKDIEISLPKGGNNTMFREHPEEEKPAGAIEYAISKIVL